MQAAGMKHRIAVFLICCAFIPGATADSDWRSFTLDNDIFVDSDDGYTNGLFVSWYDAGDSDASEQPGPPLLVRPLLWSLPDGHGGRVLNAYTVGQVIVTPENITVEDNSDLPYSGLLFFNNTHLVIGAGHADKLSTSLGIVGPSSGAESAQKWIHKLTGSDFPEGWDSQLKDEIVFKFSRARLWRAWFSQNDRMDLLLIGEATLGTIDSSLSGSVMLRYGEGLAQSFAMPVLSSTKTSNPVAFKSGWYLYIGVTARHLFNQIFTDGNTFRDSPSIDAEKSQLGAMIGFAYSWQTVSLTLAVSDINLVGDKLETEFPELTRYGTLTLAWGYD